MRKSAALFLLASAFVAGCSEPQSSPDAPAVPQGEPLRPTIVIVIVDTLRKDHLSAYGYPKPTSPNLERLAADGVRFDRALSTAPWTTPSVASLLTSRYPRSVGIRRTKSKLPDELDLLPEVLRAAGYRTVGIISHSFLGRRWNFDQGYDKFDESNVLGYSNVTSKEITDRALKLLDAQAEFDAPVFLLVHYFDPHAAYVDQEEPGFEAPADYAGAISSAMPFRLIESQAPGFDEADLDELRRLYDSEIVHTDREVGRLFDGLRDRGLYEQGLVVFTSDHGEAFGDHGHVGHTFNLYDELVNVPLLVKFPRSLGGAGRQVTTPVSLVDVMPTILRLTDIAPPEGLIGVPLDARQDPPAGRTLFTETGRSRGVRAILRGDQKLVHWVGQDRWERFDLARDPGEQDNLLQGPPPEDDELLRELQAWDAQQDAQTLDGGERQLSPEEQARIKALGYGGDDDE